MVALTHAQNQDGVLIGHAFSRLGFEVSYFDFQREPQSKLVEMSRLLEPEIVFVTKGQGLERATLKRVRQHTEKLVMWYPDAYLPEDRGYGHEYLADLLPEFHTALINYRGLVNPLSRYNRECHFAPAFFDNHFFKVDELTDDDLETFGCDAVFIGNNQRVYGTERIVALKAVSRVCDLKIWGLGWYIRIPWGVTSIAKLGMTGRERHSLRLDIWKAVMNARPPIKLTRFARAVMGQELTDNSLSKAYQCSKIGLNVGTFHLQKANIDLGFSDRLYECMGNARAYLTPQIMNLDEWFEENREIVTYSSRIGLLSKLRYLLENDDERRNIGQRGYAKIMRFHTIDVRIQQYLDIIYGRTCPFDCRHDSRTGPRK
jgi:hypothetical protein